MLELRPILRQFNFLASDIQLDASEIPVPKLNPFILIQPSARLSIC